MQYTHKKKVKLASKIQHLKRKKDFIKVFSIIKQDNTISAVENLNGMFMMFHKLSNSTYAKIEEALKEIDVRRAQRTLDSATSDSVGDYQPYNDNDEFPSQKNVSAKLKFSNREKSLIKRRRYDKNINIYNDTENDSEVVYTSYDATVVTEASTHNPDKKEEGEEDTTTKDNLITEMSENTPKAPVKKPRKKPAAKKPAAKKPAAKKPAAKKPAAKSVSV